MAEPLVAIITRTQDRPITLDRALRGILAQTFTDWRLVLVSDAGNLPAIRAVIEPPRGGAGRPSAADSPRTQRGHAGSKQSRHRRKPQPLHRHP